MKKIVLTALLLAVNCLAHAEIRLIAFADVKVKPDTAMLRVYISQTDMDLAKLNKKLEAKLSVFTNAIASVEGVQAFRILSRNIEVDESSRYGRSNSDDLPTILRGVYEIFMELEPTDNCISSFIEIAVENNAKLDNQGRYYGGQGLVQYGLKNFKNPMNEAYNIALSRAQKNAESMAKASGLSLKKLVKVENIGSSDPCYRYSEHESEYPSRFLSNNPNEIRVNVVHQFTFETE